MSAELNVQEVSPEDASPRRWMAMLHGIFGSGRNWGQVARRLVEARPEWGVLLVDLRQHGESMGFEPPHTLERTAADLESLSQGRDVRAIMGHSFGGKVALLRAHGDERIEQVWVIDSTPAASDPEGGAWTVLRILKTLPDRVEAREAAVSALEQRGVARSTALWLTMNLERDDDAYGWRLDLDDMEALLDDFYRADLWSMVEEPRPGLELHFVRATGSSFLSAEATERIRAAGEATGRVFLHAVQGGHWLNADNPDALVDLLARGL